ncbi:MAG: LuxE/PaaK family acyltransferase [bacterium JZ-2024 1]
MKTIRDAIFQFISGWDERVRVEDDATFADLAVRLFRFQFGRNEVYRNYCKALGVTPRSIKHWRDIPALPVSAFKEFRVSTVSPDRVNAVFHTTGTTYGGKRHGKHYFATLRFYEIAAVKTFRAFCMPDFPPHARIPFLVAFPSPEILPHSSLSFMLELLKKTFGDEQSETFVLDKPLWDQLASRLDTLVRKGSPSFILGSTLHLMDFLRYLRSANLRYRLPEGSRVMDTGGSKSLAFSLSREEFLSDVQQFLGIPPDFVINEYGMTELTSQCYDGHVVARLIDRHGNGQFTGKMCPPWVRVVLVDPESLEPAPGLRENLIRIYDLANVDSVIAIQTEDIGIRFPSGGWDIVGRLPHAEPRGCSLSASDFLATMKK